MSSERVVSVVRIGPIERHPNADRLSITRVHGGYPVILRTGEFSEGDLAVYVPVDSMVPEGDPRWAFLKGDRRIRAKKMRGVFSMGLLTAIEPGFQLGQDVGAQLGITHYEPTLDNPAEDEPDPGLFPTYTDIEPLRRWADILHPDEDVVMTEKVHGTNGRFVFSDGRLWCGSRTRWKRRSPSSPWWSAAEHAGMEHKLARRPSVVVYGEVYGRVQELRYGQPDHVRFAAFDAFDLQTGRFLDYPDFVALMDELELPMVPVLYEGPWKEAPEGLAEGPTVIGGGVHVREGFVVRPQHERFDDRVGRVILKLHGEGYLTR
jgi:RNA ligase (TIGR02306 family)